MLTYQLFVLSEKRHSTVMGYYSVLINKIFEWLGLDRSLPLASQEPNPRVLGALPEHYITDIGQFNHCSFSLVADIKKSFYPKRAQHVSLLIDLVTALLGCSKLTKNIHLRAAIVENLYYYLILAPEQTKKEFYQSQFFKRNALPGLLTFYVEIEKSGDRNAYYAKFGYRAAVAGILLAVIDEPEYKAAIQKVLFQEEGEKFVYIMLNDLNYFFDEGFEKMPEIKKLIEKKAGGIPLSAAEEQSLSQTEKVCSSDFRQGNDLMQILVKLVEINRGVLRTESNSKKVAINLNYYLSKISRDRFPEIRFPGYQKLQLRPIFLITSIMKIFGALRFDENFVDEVVNDERSFSVDNLYNAASVKKKEGDLTLEEVSAFDDFLAMVTIKHNKKQEVDEVIGDDYPEEFQCGLLFTIMRDPVKLPTSGVVCDRSAIKDHLLNNESDPFNRMPLKFSQLVELPELKAKINAFIMERQKKKIKGGEGIEMEEETEEQQPNPSLFFGQNIYNQHRE